MRKAIGLSVAVLLAAIGTLVLLSYVRSAEDRALAGEELVEVLVTDAAIAKGTAASTITDVRTERVPIKVRAADAVASLNELDGKVTAVDLVAGEQLVATRFVAPAELAQASEVEVPEGMQVVTISLSPTRTLGGELRPGDRVGVFASFDEVSTNGEPAEGEEAPPADSVSGPTTHLILHKVLVTNVQGEPQPTPDADEDTIDPATGRPGAPENSLFITLALTPGDAERLVFTAEYGSIWLSLQPESAVEDGTAVRTMDTIYR